VGQGQGSAAQSGGRLFMRLDNIPASLQICFGDCGTAAEKEPSSAARQESCPAQKRRAIEHSVRQ